MRLVFLFALSFILVLSAQAQVVNIPDANFKNALLTHVPVINTNNDGEIQVSEALAFTGTMNVSNKNIADMTGVEVFSNMTFLKCTNNQITAFSSTGLISVTDLWLSDNKLTSLSLNNMPKLGYLFCQSNLLTTLNLVNLPLLSQLFLDGNKLPSISLSNLPSLTSLGCTRNLLTSISLSNVNSLKFFNCSDNKLNTLPAVPSLLAINCSNNLFTSLALSIFNSLTWLYCDNNQITSLSLPNPGILTNLNCSFNKLSALPAGLISLQYLNCSYNQITSLSLNTSASLNYLNFDHNLCTSFSLSNKSLLTDIRCKNNLLTSLAVTNLPALKYLRCDSNQIADLVLTNFPVLHDIICSDNLLTTLTVSNLPSLWELYCSRNKLGSLVINNFPALERFASDYNLLTSLTVSNLPALQLFSCSYNQLTSLLLPSLPALTDLYCPNNKITSLSMVNFPSLRYLTCYNNNIRSLILQNLPSLGNIQCQQNLYDTLILNGLPALYYLNCGKNDSLINLSLTNLPVLQRLDCDSTKLVTMDLSQTDVKQLFCSKNPLLTYIDLKNGAFTTASNNLDFRLNNALEFVCGDSSELSFINTALNIQLPRQGVSVSSLCNYNAFNTIKGKLLFDGTGNGCNNQDSSMYNIKIKIDDGTQTGYTFTNTLGNYKFFVLQSINTITPVFEIPYFNSTPSSHTITFTGLGNTQVADFCITANGIHPDLEIKLLPLTIARPGFPTQYKLVFRNKGNQLQSGTVTLDFDAVKLNFLSAIPNVTSQTAGNLSWNYSGLSPYETRTITLILLVNAPPVVNIGDILTFTAIINPITGDEMPNDNTFTFNQIVRGAYDPNDKDVTEGAAIDISKAGDYLHYIIRFQNTGNEAAISVVIKDSLADNLDWNSFMPVSASHPYRAVVSKGNKVEFIFDGINLPGKNTNEPASHGFVSFKIKPKSTIAVGETIYNKAEIYFDYNLPIVTNTVSTTIVNPKKSDNLIDLSVYSNPVKDEIRFTVKAGSQIKAVNLYNTVGEKLYSETVTTPGTDRKVNIANLPTGMLFLEVITNGGTAVQKVIRIR